MFPDKFSIQFSAVFVTFLLWFINSLLLLASHLKDNRLDHELNMADRPVLAPDTTGDTTVEYKNYARSVEKNDHRLLKGFLLLSIGVILNYAVNGSKTAGDVFSLVILFSLAISTPLFLFGFPRAGNSLWILISLALLGLYITPWCYSGRNGY